MVCPEQLLVYGRIKPWSEAAPGCVLCLGKVRDLCCELLYPFMYCLAGREDYWVGGFCANASGSPPASARLILSLAKQLNSN